MKYPERPLTEEEIKLEKKRIFSWGTVVIACTTIIAIAFGCRNNK